VADKFADAQHSLRRLAAVMMKSGHGKLRRFSALIFGRFVTLKSDQPFEAQIMIFPRAFRSNREGMYEQT